MAQLDAIESEAEQESVLLQRGCAKTNLGAGTKANWGKAKPRLKALQPAYKDNYAAATSGLRTGALLGLLPRIAQFVTDYARERKRAERADFDDLLFWARDLLRDSRSARDYFAAASASC